VCSLQRGQQKPFCPQYQSGEVGQCHADFVWIFVNHNRTLFRNHKLLKNKQSRRAMTSPRGVEGLKSVASLAGEGKAAWQCACVCRWRSGIGVLCRGRSVPRARCLRRLELPPLSYRDKTHHLTPRATESGYEHTQTKVLARTVARQFCLTEVNGNMGDREFWRRGGDSNLQKKL
jgi:hypothetical protein